MPVYSDTFFKQRLEGSLRSASLIMPRVLELVRPRSMVDVGCGVGTWLSVVVQHGVDDILGVDGEYVRPDSLLIPTAKFRSHDLRQPLRLDRRFDLAISLEVGEHLPATCAASFVESLTRLAPVVLFSAAIPYQGGNDHVNEQWPEYWAGLFRPLGFVPVDCIRELIWNDPGVEWWYAQNTLLYVEAAELPNYPTLQPAHGAVRALVHPRKYLEVAPAAQWLHRIGRPFLPRRLREWFKRRLAGQHCGR